MTICEQEAFQQLLSAVREKIDLGNPLGTELYRVFEQQSLTTLFQPIVSLQSKAVMGWEALTRGPLHSPLHRPLDLFYVAEQMDCLLELDMLTRMLAIERFANYQRHEKLFINVLISSLSTSKHTPGITQHCMDKTGLRNEQVVIELSELHPTDDLPVLVEAINHYQKQGFVVALDDVGAGYNGMRLWSEIRPNIVKIDRYFVDGVHQAREKRRFLETMVNLAHGFNAKVVAEGVEREEELRVLEQLGVDYVQGFLLGRPEPAPGVKLAYSWPEARLRDIRQENTAAILAKPALTLRPDEKVGAVAERILKMPEHDFFPVVDEAGQVHGMVWRRDLMQQLLQRFGYELNYRKKIEELMDKHPIVVEGSVSLESLSRRLTDTLTSGHREAFILLKEGRYEGVGTFIDLLRVITDLKVKSAQYANPLSGLPGNVPIQAEIQGLLDRKVAFSVLYIDLDHFKPFNDFYSYEDGDKIIRFLSSLLREQVPQEAFLGHIGGDDFMVILPWQDERVESLAARLVERFKAGVQDFYSKEDRQAGGIQGIDRQGRSVFFPMMSISIGILKVAQGAISHQQKLSSLVTKAKKQAKSQGGNTWAVIEAKA